MQDPHTQGVVLHLEGVASSWDKELHVEVAGSDGSTGGHGQA